MMQNHPPLIIYDEDKREYYAALQTYDESEEIATLVDFLRSQTEKTWTKTVGRGGEVKRKGLDDY